MNSDVDNPFQSPFILSLCTGMRGLERGIERVIGSVRTVAYVEIEAFVIENLVKQMEQGVLAPAPIWTDVKTFPSQEFYGKVHWITGGYPCQPFSTAGKQKGTEDPRHIWPYINKAIGIIRPFGCFFENVANHLNIGYEQVKADLEEMGYAVKEGIYSAEEVGAPHRRKRLFILAVAYNDGFDWKLSIREQEQKRNIEIKSINAKGSCAELGNAGLHRSEIRQVETTGTKQSGEELAHTDGSGFTNQWISGIKRKEKDERAGYSSTCLWPAGQGFHQYEWEEPRTVKPGLGCTINGYNFKEDLLRMYGNGVVEQTAGLAFIDLLNKHLKN